MRHWLWLVKAQNCSGSAFHLQTHPLLRKNILQRKIKREPRWIFFFRWGTNKFWFQHVPQLPRAEKLKTVLQYHISKAALGLAAKAIKWFLPQKITTSWITLSSRNNELVGTTLCCREASQLDSELWMLSCPLHWTRLFCTDYKKCVVWDQ